MINQNSVLPVYYQLKNHLLQRIASGEFTPGAQLPSETALAAEYGVSRQAVRRALGELGAQGIVSARKGIGSFVNGQKVSKPLPILTSYTAQMATQSSDSEVRVISRRVEKADALVAQALSLAEEAPVLRIERLGLMASEPVTLLVAFYPSDLCPALEHEDIEGASLYRLLDESCGLRFVRASSKLQVTFADPRQASLLQVKEGHPLIELSGTAYLTDGRPGEYTLVAYRHERFQFTIESQVGAKNHQSLGS